KQSDAVYCFCFFFQAEDGIRDFHVTGVDVCSSDLRPQRDEDGHIIKDAKGKPKSDNALKDKENIPLKEDIDGFFAKEVTPFVPDAWYKKSETKIGYEINFAKYFYQHKAPRSLEEISADIFKIEEETEHLLKEIVEA